MRSIKRDELRTFVETETNEKIRLQQKGDSTFFLLNNRPLLKSDVNGNLSIQTSVKKFRDILNVLLQDM